MRRTLVFALNCLLLFVFAVVVEMRNPGTAEGPIGFGIGVLMILAPVLAAHWIAWRFMGMGPRGGWIFTVAASLATVFMVGAVSGLIAVGLAAGALVAFSLAFCPAPRRERPTFGGHHARWSYKS